MVFSAAPVMSISCHQCGNMYDGNSFMNVEGFDECVGTMEDQELNQCPADDKCCFALREHIAFDFWGRKYNVHLL